MGLTEGLKGYAPARIRHRYICAAKEPDKRTHSHAHAQAQALRCSGSQ